MASSSPRVTAGCLEDEADTADTELEPARLLACLARLLATDEDSAEGRFLADVSELDAMLWEGREVDGMSSLDRRLYSSGSSAGCARRLYRVFLFTKQLSADIAVVKDHLDVKPCSTLAQYM
jgi:hypothetical protein